MTAHDYNAVFKPYVPPHVPADLVVDFDYHNDARLADDPQAGIKTLETDCPPIFFTPRFGGHWVLARAALVEEALHDPETFSSASVTIPLGAKTPFQLVPIELDPPEHMDYRQLLARPFSPRAIATLSEHLRADARALVESVAPRGRCDFAREMANRFPIDAFLRMAGLPLEHRAFLIEWAEQIVHAQDVDKRRDTFNKATEYLHGIIADRRRAPGEDLMSTIVHADVQGRPMPDERLIGFLQTLLFGGLDTVTQTMNFLQKCLAEHPDQRQLLVDDPNLIPDGIEEMLRRYPVSMGKGRLASRDVEFHGVTIKRGDAVFVPMSLIGLDETVFLDPLKVDFRRSNIRSSTFSVGVHRCPGSHLARLELRIFFEEWLARIPAFALEPGARIEVTAGSISGIKNLPLVWDVRH